MHWRSLISICRQPAPSSAERQNRDRTGSTSRPMPPSRNSPIRSAGTCFSSAVILCTGSAAASALALAACCSGVSAGFSGAGGCVDCYHENATGTARQIASRTTFRDGTRRQRRAMIIAPCAALRCAVAGRSAVAAAEVSASVSGSPASPGCPAAGRFAG